MRGLWWCSRRPHAPVVLSEAKDRCNSQQLHRSFVAKTATQDDNLSEVISPKCGVDNFDKTRRNPVNRG